MRWDIFVGGPRFQRLLDSYGFRRQSFGWKSKQKTFLLDSGTTKVLSIDTRSHAIASNGFALFRLKCPPKVAATLFDVVHFFASSFHGLDTNDPSKRAPSFDAIVTLFKAVPADGVLHFVRANELSRRNFSVTLTVVQHKVTDLREGREILKQANTFWQQLENPGPQIAVRHSQWWKFPSLLSMFQKRPSTSI
jgi:hypothetical protein